MKLVFFAGRTHKANAWGLYEKALFTSCLFTILTVFMFIVMSCGHTVSKHVDNILLLANGRRNSITVVVGWGTLSGKYLYSPGTKTTFNYMFLLIERVVNVHTNNLMYLIFHVG